MREVDLTFAKFCNANAELRKRNAKALAYSESVCKRKHEYNKEAIFNIAMALCVLAIVLIIFVKAFTTERRYAVPYDNGAYHYTYVTERICTVTETTNNLITVDYKGNLYSFYGNGYKAGEKIVCQFTDDWQIVGVVE